MNRLYVFLLTIAFLSTACERRVKDSVKHIRFNPYPATHQAVWAAMGNVTAQLKPAGSVQLTFGESAAVTLQADFLNHDSLEIEFFAGYFRLESADARLHICADKDVVWLYAEAGGPLNFSFSQPLAPINPKTYQFELKGDTGNRVYLHSSQPCHVDSQRIDYNGRELVLAFSTSAELDENPNAPRFFEQKFLDTFQTWNGTFAEFELEWRDKQSRGPFYTDAYLALRPTPFISAASAFEFMLKQTAFNSPAAEFAREALTMLGLTAEGQMITFNVPAIKTALINIKPPLQITTRGSGTRLEQVTKDEKPIQTITVSELLSGGNITFYSR